MSYTFSFVDIRGDIFLYTPHVPQYMCKPLSVSDIQDTEGVKISMSTDMTVINEFISDIGPIISILYSDSHIKAT